MYRFLYSVWFRVFQGMQARIKMRHIKKKMSKVTRQILYDWSRWAALPSSRLLTWYVLRKDIIFSFQLIINLICSLENFSSHIVQCIQGTKVALCNLPKLAVLTLTASFRILSHERKLQRDRISNLMNESFSFVYTRHSKHAVYKLKWINRNDRVTGIRN